MEETLIQFETSKLAVSKGFSRDAKSHYNASGKVARKVTDYIMSSVWPRVTQSLLQKWLREEHNIHITINPYGDTVHWHISAISFTNKTTEDGRLIYYHRNSELMEIKFKTYEQALEAALQESLKTI